MRRVLFLLSACFVTSTVFASVAVAQTDPSESPYGILCGSFGSQLGAQQYYDFNATAEEQAIMDPNGDGLACTPEDGNIVVEELTGAPAQNPDAPVGEFSGLTPPALGDSAAAASDPVEFERSELNPNGPCFDPEVADDVVGVPVENLANAYINRNDPIGTPLVSPLDSNNSGIACDALTQEEAASISAGEIDQGQPVTPDDTATTPPAADQPAGDDVADDDMIALPDTGGPALLLPIAGLAMIGLGGLILKRRLS